MHAELLAARPGGGCLGSGLDNLRVQGQSAALGPLGAGFPCRAPHACRHRGAGALGSASGSVSRVAKHWFYQLHPCVAVPFGLTAFAMAWEGRICRCRCRFPAGARRLSPRWVCSGALQIPRSAGIRLISLLYRNSADYRGRTCSPLPSPALRLESTFCTVYKRQN